MFSLHTGGDQSTILYQLDRRKSPDLRYMDRHHLFDQLARHGEIFRTMLTGLRANEVLWKPEPVKWCALEVACHLYDEEREDFRARLASTLETPEKPWPKIDPQAWVAERGYIDLDLSSVLADLLLERERSVSWLRGLADAPWDNVHMHPKVVLGRVDLRLMYCVANDLHRIRQVN